MKNYKKIYEELEFIKTLDITGLDFNNDQDFKVVEKLIFND